MQRAEALKIIQTSGFSKCQQNALVALFDLNAAPGAEEKKQEADPVVVDPVKVQQQDL